MHVLVEALLEDPAAEIIGLPGHNFAHGLAKLVVADAAFPRRLCKPGGLEGTPGFARFSHANM
jgi:hypothetical protein